MRPHKWKRTGNNLDEMQEQEMLHIEKKCFWILYLMLACSIIIQKILGYPLREYAAEGICFLTVSVIMVGTCILQGVWDRHLKADGRTNFLVSILGGFAAAVISTITVCITYGSDVANGKQRVIVGGVTFAITFLITFVICMILMNFCTYLYKKRRDSLENEEDETDD